jgi:hypothetical protein
MSISVRDALITFKKPALIGLIGLIGVVLGYVIDTKVFSDTAPVQPINFNPRPVFQASTSV